MRKSERTNKGKLPVRLHDYSMGSESSDDLDETVKTAEMETQLENLRLQMEEMSRSLAAERAERKRLADELNQERTSAAQQLSSKQLPLPTDTTIAPNLASVFVISPTTIYTAHQFRRKFCEWSFEQHFAACRKKKNRSIANVLRSTRRVARLQSFIPGIQCKHGIFQLGESFAFKQQSNWKRKGIR